MKKEELFLAIALIIFIASKASAATAPLFGDTDEEIILCESSALSYNLNITDIDGGDLEVMISPSGPFFARTISSEVPITQIEIFSDNLTKSLSNKIYEKTISVSDGQFSDSRNIKITVLESNNPPQIEPLSIETIIINDSGQFYKKVFATDLESGDQDSGNFSFTISDSLNELALGINPLGIINMTKDSLKPGLHEIKVCATDSGVKITSEKIGFCGQGDLKKTTCRTFPMVLINKNTAPTILLFNSTNQSSQIVGTNSVSFQVYKFDPDGAIPETRWYVDDKLRQADSDDASDKFTYSFGCNAWGKHIIKAVVTDGLQEDSVEWKFDVIKFVCPEGIIAGEKIGGKKCEEKWGCYDWTPCQNAAKSAEIGVLTKGDYEAVRADCLKENLNEDLCGFQMRLCLEVNNCGTLDKKPSEIISCSFSQGQDCSDKIKNCHDGQCEILPDCGGPCDPCPTCSDGIKNQREGFADCGGPCLEECPERLVSPREKSIKQKFLIVMIVLSIVVIAQIVWVMKTKEKLEKPSPRRRKDEKI
jgi:hypothetical protein